MPAFTLVNRCIAVLGQCIIVSMAVGVITVIPSTLFELAVWMSYQYIIAIILMQIMALVYIVTLNIIEQYRTTRDPEKFIYQTSLAAKLSMIALHLTAFNFCVQVLHLELNRMIIVGTMFAINAFTITRIFADILA